MSKDLLPGDPERAVTELLKAVRKDANAIKPHVREMLVVNLHRLHARLGSDEVSVSALLQAVDLLSKMGGIVDKTPAGEAAAKPTFSVVINTGSAKPTTITAQPYSVPDVEVVDMTDASADTSAVPDFSKDEDAGS